MKPPRRLRALPARLLERSLSSEGPQRGRWGVREKRKLLAALRDQARRGLPEQLLPAALREKLPRRSEAEIRVFLRRLRGRAAREGLSCKFQNFLRSQRHIRAPIQVWQDLTETLMGGALEGPPSAAFSQVLTVAATEPLTLKHSKTPQNSGSPQNLEPPQNSGTSQNLGNPQNSETPNPEGLEVDFGKIYQFLAKISSGGEETQLGPAEAAVVLSLLGALPAQLGALGGALGTLRRHFRGVWGSLSAPRGPAPSQCPPLNPLLVSLALLGRAA